MAEQRRAIPEADQIIIALEEMIGPRLSQPIYADESDIARVRAVLTLDCVGGPAMPTMAEREERFQAVRGLLRELAPRFGDLPRSELAHLTYPRGEPRGDTRYQREAKRLAIGAKALFQLHSAEPDPDAEINEIQSAANLVWGKPKYPDSRWFKRERQDFVLAKLAELIVEAEQAYREANSLLAPESQPELAAATISPSAGSSSENVRDPLEESSQPEPTGEVSDETADGDSGDESSADLDDPQPVVRASPLEPGRRLRIGRLAGGVFIATLITGALVVFALSVGRSESAGNAAGEIHRVLNVRAPEDLAVAGGFVWLVDANNETAIRVSEANGQRETIFVDQPPFVSKSLPGTHTGARVGGYRVAAGPNEAWIVTNGGVVLTIGTTGRQVRILNPHISVLAGKPVLYRGSLWVAGFGGYLSRLRARDGAIQREYKLRGDPFVIDSLAAGVGSIWAYSDNGGGEDPKINVLTPVSGRLGVEEAVLPLDQPAFDLAAGLGGVWTVDLGGTVTWHDPATGASSRIRVPGGAQALALGQDAAWVTTGNDTVVRIDPATLAMVGAPIKLPDSPVALAADRNVWVATDRKLIEIKS